MAQAVLRVRLVGGDQVDVTYEDPRAHDPGEAAERAIAILSSDASALRCVHGDRLVVVFGRGVAAVEVAPRGAVL